MGNQPNSGAFTARDVQILVETSGKSEDEIRQWYQTFHQESDSTDRMNKRQFQSLYTKLKNNPKLEAITDHIFRTFDADHSGKIDFSEFLLAYIATTEGSTRRKFEYAFEVYDINDDEYIDKKEARKVLEIVCQILGFSEHDAKAYATTLILSFDADNDQRLTRAEFIDGCLHDLALGKITNPFAL